MAKRPGGGLMMALHAVDVVKKFGDRAALHDLGLTVPAGQLVALVGHNGSGKSTFLDMAAGLSEPTSGSIEVVGNQPGSIEARADVSFLPDAPALYDDLSIFEQCAYVAALHGVEDPAAEVGNLLDRLGIGTRGDDLPIRLSRGMRQKASIALAFVRPFKLLLVDEPFVGLDTTGRQVIKELIAEACADGASAIVATHQLDFVREADRIVALRDGRKIHDGAATEAEVADWVLP